MGREKDETVDPSKSLNKENNLPIFSPGRVLLLRRQTPQATVNMQRKMGIIGAAAVAFPFCNRMFHRKFQLAMLKIIDCNASNCLSSNYDPLRKFGEQSRI